MAKKVDLKVGYSCNNNCIHCVVADNRALCQARGIEENLSTSSLLAELADSRQSGCGSVVFTGGEPTLRNDLPYLVHSALSLGYAVDIQTNGRALACWRYARALCERAPLSFCVALHGSTAVVHDAVTSVTGSFFETVAGLRNLVRLGQGVAGKVVISKVNYRSLAGLCRFYAELGVTDITLAFPHALGNAGRFFDEVVPLYSETTAPLKEALETCRALGVTARTEAYPLCFLEGYESHAVELHFYDEETELRQLGHEHPVIDWTRARRENKMKFPACLSCRYDLICEGPWREYPAMRGCGEFHAVHGIKVAHPLAVLSERKA
ncbi:MAG: radical SAM protein [Candidatus Eremiobacteraeota bacterium]|nr:radical SAM protein [Candidatus Eremiobacteraeota bacterium]